MELYRSSSIVRRFSCVIIDCQSVAMVFKVRDELSLIIDVRELLSISKNFD